MEFAGDTIEEQTEQVMSNMGEILKEAGADFKDVVKTTISADMGDFKTVNPRQAPREPSRARHLASTPLNARRDRLHRLPPLDAPASARARGSRAHLREIQHILLNLFTRRVLAPPGGLVVISPALAPPSSQQWHRHPSCGRARSLPCT